MDARLLALRSRVLRGHGATLTAMDVRSVTVGLPVSDLPRAAAWYRRVFGLSEPDLAPAAGVVDYFDFSDPDGNNLSLYSVL